MPSRVVLLDRRERLYVADQPRPADRLGASLFRAKIFVEMLMATECAFKSIILSLSPKTETPEEAYKLMRDCSHDLSKLAAEAGKRCRRRIAFLDRKELAVLQQASAVGVRSRYSVDVFFMLSQEALEDRFFGSGKISATLEDDAWMSAFYNVVKRAFIISKRASSIGCDKQRAILGSDSKKVDDRFKQFLKANNIKP